MGIWNEHGRRRALIALSAAALALLLVAASALAHVERTTYWPNPAPDTSVSPAAGSAASRRTAYGKGVCRPDPSARRCS